MPNFGSGLAQTCMGYKLWMCVCVCIPAPSQLESILPLLLSAWIFKILPIIIMGFNTVTVSNGNTQAVINEPVSLYLSASWKAQLKRRLDVTKLYHDGTLSNHLTVSSRRQTFARPAWSPPSCWGGRRGGRGGRRPRKWWWSQTGELGGYWQAKVRYVLANARFVLLFLGGATINFWRWTFLLFLVENLPLWQKHLLKLLRFQYTSRVSRLHWRERFIEKKCLRQNIAPANRKLFIVVVFAFPQPILGEPLKVLWNSKLTF